MDRQSRIDDMLDRLAIEDCLRRFSRGMDRFDRACFLSAFHPDATIAAGVFVGQPDALYDWARHLHEQGQHATQHNLLNIVCDINGDEAHTETNYLFVARNRDDSNWIAGGRYIDRFERRDGVWAVATRTTTVEWSGILPSMALPFADVPDIHGNGAPARDRSDPSYQRPLTNRRAPFNPGRDG